MKVKIFYPQMTIFEKEVEVSEEDYEFAIDNEEDFIYSHLNLDEKRGIIGDLGSAIEMGYAGLKLP